MSDKYSAESPISGKLDKPTEEFTLLSLGNSVDSFGSNSSESAIAMKSGNSKSSSSVSGVSSSLAVKSAVKFSLTVSDCHENSSSYSSEDSSSSKLTASNIEGKEVSVGEISTP